MKRSKNFIFIISLIVALVFYGNSVKAATSEEVSGLIAGLQEEILNYQQKILELTSRILDLQKEIAKGEEADGWCYTFNNNLDYSMKGEDVSALHTALSKEGFDCGSDAARGYFWANTVNAVKSFQEKYKEEILGPWGFRSGTGFVGTTTRQQLNELYGCAEAEEDEELVLEEGSEEEPEVQEETEEVEITEEEAGAGTEESVAGVCFDSDSGKDYYSKGYATTDGGETKEWDSCRYFYTAERSLDVLYEVYCGEGEIKIDEHQCLLGCMFSACVEHRQSDLAISSLSIEPEGPVTTEKLTVKGTLKNTGNVEAIDVSLGYSITEGKNEAQFSKGVSDWKGNLAPESETDFSFEIPKAFAREENYKLVLTVDPENRIIESSEGNNQTTTEFFVMEKPICLDSDGKKDFYSRGYTTMDEGLNKSWDLCSYDKKTRQYTVSENYCDNNVPKTESFPCPQGCLNGVCIKKGLIAEFSFEEQGNLIEDSSGNGMKGTVSGAERIDGVAGKALQFGGSGYASIKDNSLLDFVLEGTISAWIKYDSSGRGGVVLSKCKSSNSFGTCNYALKLENLTFNSFGLWVGDGKPGFSDSAVLPSGSMEKNVWYYVVGVFDEYSLKIYVNGELKRSGLKSISDPPGINDSDLLIGSMTCNSFADCNHFKGAVDELKIYNYALSAAEVKANYEQY